MTAHSTSAKVIHYPRRSLDRAKRALRCSPFRVHLFSTMRLEGVSLKAIAGEVGVRNQYTRRSLSELIAENGLLWLIQVGVLRREVDGQGLTDSFRLTPLGRQLLDQWSQGNWQSNPTLLDRLYNALSRWFRLPL